MAAFGLFGEGSPRWLSANPDRAWGERFFLLYIPVWVTLMGGWSMLFASDGWGDLAILLFGALIAGPLLPSCPIFYFLDESSDERWSLWQVFTVSMCASWVGLFLTDLCTHAIGTL